MSEPAAEPPEWKPDGTGKRRIDWTPTTCNSSANVAYDEGYQKALHDAAIRMGRAEVLWQSEPDDHPNKAERLSQYSEARAVLVAWAAHPQVVVLNTARRLSS